ncbi:ribonuclease H [Methanoculleus sediminis]|uniref:Ribonuclease H n=1 Tax=Methanoculleus sediminis TaxID=1550566 RepID=A0A0H1R8R4_9EURY|nr:ribonuclease HI family protein [Methanoculleus sediminis]KLK89012.1 ribonuclease H [Methanoculleus sediminis]
MTKTDAVTLYTDGASRGNPGDAAWAYVIVRDDSVVAGRSGYIGTATNNVAEYHAVINGLDAAREFTSGRLTVRSDSELVVRQLTGRYRITKEHLADLAEEVRRRMRHFAEIGFESVPREHPCIRVADRLCNETLDAKRRGRR